MLSSKDVINYCNNELFIYDLNQLKKFNLNIETIEFLSTVGFPKQANFTQYLLTNLLVELESKVIDNKRYVKILSQKNTDDGLYISEIDGSVHYFNSITISNKISFCNSSIKNYVKFGTIEDMIYKQYKNIEDDDSERYHCAKEIIENFTQIDKSAIYPYSFWVNKMLDYAIDFFYDEDDRFQNLFKTNKYKEMEDAYFDVLLNGVKY